MVLTKNNDQYGVVFDNRGNPEYMVFETTTKSYSKKWFISFEKRNLRIKCFFSMKLQMIFRHKAEW